MKKEVIKYQRKQSFSLVKLLGIDICKHHIIAFVGGGGKTTLIYELAKELKKYGCRVAVTTTTHMIPREVGVIDTFGVPTGELKISALPCNQFDQLCDCYDIILVEADGSKRKPMKAPASHEPVIPKKTNLVVGIEGAAAIGQPLKEVCHRFELAQNVLDVEENHQITLDDLVTLLYSEQGQMKKVSVDYRAVIGQADLL